MIKSTVRKTAVFFLSLLASVFCQAASVTMAWDPNPSTDGVTQYRVYQSVGTNAFVLAGTTPATTTSFTVSNLTNFVTYRWYVTAYSAVESAPSSTITNTPSAAPRAPSNLSVTVISSARMDLNWQNNSPEATAFVIQRSTGTSMPFSPIAIVASSSTSFIDTYGLKSNSRYCYRIASENGDMQSAWDGPVCDRTFKR